MEDSKKDISSLPTSAKESGRKPSLSTGLRVGSNKNPRTLGLQCCICIFIVIAFYSILAGVIAVFPDQVTGIVIQIFKILFSPNNKYFESESTDRNSETSRTMEQIGCSANSFLIGDGTCDEVTNNARCLFDGGDCCLQDKVTSLCQNCTCIVDINKVDLNRKLKSQMVKALTSGLDIGTKFEARKTIADVLSRDVCLTLCFQEQEEAVDSIIYKPDNDTCTCAFFSGCYLDCQVKSLANSNSNILIMTAKALECRN